MWLLLCRSLLPPLHLLWGLFLRTHAAGLLLSLLRLLRLASSTSLLLRAWLLLLLLLLLLRRHQCRRLECVAVDDCESHGLQH